MLGLVTAVLTARWIWIAGITDYAWTYELGMRVWRGEVPYRDFVCALPQLTSYTLVPFLALLKGNLWGFAIHLYLWWLASLWVGWRVSQRLGLSRALQSAAIFLAACVSFPPNGLGHAYSYAGTFFFALLLLCLLRHQETPELKRVLWGGVWAGLALLAKQNIGGVAVLFGLFGFAQDARSRENDARPIRDLGGFGTSVALTFLPAFAFFAFHAGPVEVLTQMFLDAGAGKGGLEALITHALPLLFFTPETPFRHLWTIAISGLVSMLLLGGLAWKANLGQPAVAPPTPAPEPAGIGWYVAQVAALAAVVVICGISLVPWPAVKQLCNALSSRYLHGYTGLVIFLLYAALTALSVIFLLRVILHRQPKLFVAALALPAILWGHEISAHGYLVYGAPLAIPLALWILEKHLPMRGAGYLAGALGVLMVFTHAAFAYPTYRLGTFETLRGFPRESRFAGLMAARSSADSVNEILANVSPRIQARRTLWMCIGGPHLAYGGAPVRSVAVLHFDTYHQRSEAPLREEWQRQPPEFAFMGYYLPCVGSTHFTPEAMSAWLAQHYRPVWSSSDNKNTLWEFNSTNHPAARP
jgi:hypothetical protein